MALDELEDVGCLGARPDHDPRAGHEESLHARACERHVVRQRQHAQLAAAGCDVLDCGCRPRVVQVIVVRAGDELGNPRRPTGKQQDARVGWIDLDGGRIAGRRDGLQLVYQVGVVEG